MPRKVKRKSNTEAEAGSVQDTKLQKLNVGKRRLVSTARYHVTRSYCPSPTRSKIAVTQSEVVTFIRYHEDEIEGSNQSKYVEVITQSEKKGLIPEDILDRTIVARICCNVSFDVDASYLKHRVSKHYSNLLCEYLKDKSLTCPVENCRETFSDLKLLSLHYGGFPHARVILLQHMRNENISKIFRMFDGMDSEILGQKKQLEEIKKKRRQDKSKIRDLEKKLADFQKSEETEKEDKEDEKVKVLIEQNCKLQQKVENLLEEKKAASEDHKKLRSRSIKFNKKMQIELTNLSDDHRAVNSERERLEAELTLKSVDNVDLSMRLQDMEEERDSLDDQNEQLRKELESVRMKQKETISNMDEGLSESLDSGEKMVKRVTGKIEELKEYNVGLSKQLQDMEEERDNLDLDDQNEQLREELESVRMKQKESISKMDEGLSESIDSGEKMVKRVTVKIEELKEKMLNVNK